MGLDLREKGAPAVNAATCTGCGVCVAVCPDEVLKLENGKAKASAGIFLGCIACGHCVAACPTKSISVSGRGMKSDDAMDLASAVGRATADQLQSLLQARRSVRRFKDEPIDRAMLDRILKMTSTAPMGIPPSEVGVVVFHGHDCVQALATDACAAFAGMKWFFSPVMLRLMRPFIGKDAYEVMRGFVKPLLQFLLWQRAEGKDYFTYNAPAALLFHYNPAGGEADCHIATTYAMLAAESLGLGSCMLGTTEGLNSVKWFKRKYGIPLGNKIGLGLVLGHPAVQFHRGVRRRLASVQFH